MGIRWREEEGRLVAYDGRLHVEAPATLTFGVLGLKCVSKVKSSLPSNYAQELKALLPRQAWSRCPPPDLGAVGAVARVLATACASVGDWVEGVDLVDTMRGGSGYWRPGKLLLQVADQLREQGLSVGYARDDAWCPPPAILNGFVRERAFGFGRFCEAYAEALRRGGGLDQAGFQCLLSLARRRIAIFYCVDPHLPKFAEPFPQQVPYAERTYRSDHPDLGCHRFVLGEELARLFSQLDKTGQLLELDPSFNEVHVRSFCADL